MGRRGGMSRVMSDLEAPLLEDVDISESEAKLLDYQERRQVIVHILVGFLIAVFDIGVLGISEKDNLGFDNFNIRKNVGEIFLMVGIRSLLYNLTGIQVWFQEKYGWGLFLSYWFYFSTIVYSFGKLIMFDWKNAVFHIGVISPIGFGIGMMIVLQRLCSVVAERSRWSKKEETGQRVKQQLKQDPKDKARLSWEGMFIVMKPYFWPKGIMNKLRCVLTWVFLGLSKASNLMSPIYIGIAVQELTDHGAGEKVYWNLFLYGFLSLSSKIFKEMQNVVYLKVKQTAYVEIAEETFAHLHSLSLEWHVKKKMGNVLRSMDRGVNAANTLVTYLFLYLGPSIVECGVVFIIFYSHFQIPTLSATAFMSFIAYAVITVQITLWRKKFREQTNKHDNDYHDKASDSIINYETVKYFTAEKYEIDRYTDSIYKFQKYSVNTAYSLSFLNCTQSTIIALCTIISLCITAEQVSSGHFKVGSFVSVSAYINNLFAPLSFLGSVYNAVIQALVDMTNLSELLAEHPDLVDEPGAKALIPVPSGTNGANIEFRNVTFHYPTQPPDHGIKNLSFTISPGTTLGVVGSTGSMKTTLSRLLFRFYDPKSGQVLISGQDIKYVTQYSLRRAIGVVPQDTVLFNDTLRHNISYGNFDATQEDIEKACENAKILNFIKSLPEGFDTKVGERGLKLSGGERQRISIARCLIKNPPIVVLDEATSALDNVTERSVQDALDNLAEYRTTMVIAHRLTTIKNADQIIVLEKGKLVETGTHTQLLDKSDSYYANLWHQRRLEEEQD